MKVFFSWQSDLKEEQEFIRENLQAICDELDVEYDEDTRGTGTAEFVTDIILRKIKNSAVFVADLTPIGNTKKGTAKKKKLPNPNVCFELGYAESHLTRSQLVVTYNEANTHFDDLPFDLSKRNTVRFTLPASMQEKAAYKKRLKQAVKKALESFSKMNTAVLAGEKPLNKYEKTILYWGINQGDAIISEARRKEKGSLMLGEKALSIGDNRFWIESNLFFYNPDDSRQMALFSSALGTLLSKGYLTPIHRDGSVSSLDGKAWAITEEGEVVAKGLNEDEVHSLFIEDDPNK